jgi:hypothetical protein
MAASRPKGTSTCSRKDYLCLKWTITDACWWPCRWNRGHMGCSTATSAASTSIFTRWTCSAGPSIATTTWNRRLIQCPRAIIKTFTKPTSRQLSVTILSELTPHSGSFSTTQLWFWRHRSGTSESKALGWWTVKSHTKWLIRWLGIKPWLPSA